jgi:hypothetical protein
VAVAKARAECHSIPARARGCITARSVRYFSLEVLLCPLIFSQSCIYLSALLLSLFSADQSSGCLIPLRFFGFTFHFCSTMGYPSCDGSIEQSSNSSMRLGDHSIWLEAGFRSIQFISIVLEMRVLHACPITRWMMFAPIWSRRTYCAADRSSAQ